MFLSFIFQFFFPVFCPKKRATDIERTSHKENYKVRKEDSLRSVWFGLVQVGQIVIRFGMVQAGHLSIWAVCKLYVDIVEDGVEIGKTKQTNKQT